MNNALISAVAALSGSALGGITPIISNYLIQRGLTQRELLNRELAEQIPHLAMSIPYTLSSQCLAYLGELRPSFLSSSAVTINDSIQLNVTLCLCCSAAVEFVASVPVAAETAGELEMF